MKKMQISQEIIKIVRTLGDKLKQFNDALAKRINDHEIRRDNPHAVTKTQVGLSKIPNDVTIARDLDSDQALLLAKGMADHTDNSSDHDDRYYTQTQVDSKLAANLSEATTHTNTSVSEVNAALEDHKVSTDHDDRYFTQQQVDDKDDAVLQAAKLHADSQAQQGSSAVEGKLEDHKTSTDHDSRYYTQEQMDNAINNLSADINAALSERDDNLEAHKTSTDHDDRYYTKTQVDTTVDGVNSSVSQKDAAQTAALDAHKTSDDHDGRYYTKTEMDTTVDGINTSVSQKDTAQTAALNAHKSSTDHDVRYYTKSQVDSIESNLQDAVTAADSAQTSALTAHKSSGDHDDRYYTQDQVNALETSLRDEISQSGTSSSDALELHKTSTDHDSRYYTKAQADAAGDLKVDIASIVDDLTSTLVDVPLSANQGRVLKGLIDQLNATLLSDDATLDELQEIVDFIKLNREDLNALSISGVAGLQEALDTKVDKVSGKSLSTNDFTDALLTKLQGIEANAEVNRPITDSRNTNSATTALSAKGMHDHSQAGDHDIRYYTHGQVNSKDALTLQRAKDYADTIGAGANTQASSELNSHKTSGDHDSRYYTHQQVDDAIATAKGEAVTAADDALTAHKASTDHDGRYYTKTQVDSAISTAKAEAVSTVNTALETHKSSGDHDSRYYTKSQVDSRVGDAKTEATNAAATSLNTHKSSNDHDSRYYTQSQVDTKLGETQTAAETTASNQLNSHKSSNDHDGRYYTKAEMDTQLGAISDSIDQGVADELNAHKTSGDHDDRYYTQTQTVNRIANAEGRANSLTETRYDQVQREFVKTDIKLAAIGDDVEAMKGTEQSFQEVFDSWRRFSRRGGHGLKNDATPSELTQWVYNSSLDRIECAINSSSYIGFVSPESEKFEDYVFEAVLGSTSTDDDFISLVAAFAEDANGDGNTLDVVRRMNGDAPLEVWLNYATDFGVLIATMGDPLLWGDGTLATGYRGSGSDLPGWANGSPNGVRMKITRSGDIFTIENTQMNDSSDNYLPGATVTIDLNSRPELSVFKGPKQYGIGALSQAGSHWDFIQKPSSLEDIVDLVDNVVWEYNSTTGWTSSPITDVTQFIKPNRVYRTNGRVFVSDDLGGIVEVATRDVVTGTIHAGDSITIGGPDASGARYSVSYDSDTDSLDVTHLG